jgi:hypothetical protein
MSRLFDGPLRASRERSELAEARRSRCTTLRWRCYEYSIYVEQAFTAADMQPSERVAVRMAEGMREYNEHGEELFGILRKNIYGSPLASRNWAKCRNQYLLNEMGKEEGWKVRNMLYEPCMFIVTAVNGAVVVCACSVAVLSGRASGSYR